MRTIRIDPAPRTGTTAMGKHGGSRRVLEMRFSRVFAVLPLNVRPDQWGAVRCSIHDYKVAALPWLEMRENIDPARRA